jgi:hypothetical protein
MTLTKCDLYFADKAILVEGATERLLMPRFYEIIDKSLEEPQRLSSQYITCIEVGGAYAHIFYPLLDFLEIRTLIITDIDSVVAVAKTDKNGKNTTKLEKCPIAQGDQTSNQAIKEWFRPKSKEGPQESKTEPPPAISLADLMAKTANEKQDGYRRIAYQIPENPKLSACARSYEDALVLANPALFGLGENEDNAAEAWSIAKDMQKTDTALRFGIVENDWKVPRYIREGLEWLSRPPVPPATAPVNAPGDVPPDAVPPDAEAA